MVPYWSLICADSALKERAESPVEGASYAQIVSLLLRNIFYSIFIKILNLLKYYRHRNSFRYFVTKKYNGFFGQIFSTMRKSYRRWENVELSSRRLDCESGYWLMEGIKSFLLTQLSVCLSVCLPVLSTNTVVLRVRNSTVFSTIPFVARPQDSVKVKVQF